MSKIAFLFPGQGAQKVGMGQQVADSHPAARDLYDRARSVLGYDLAKLCFEGPEEKLNSTIYSQPALFVTSLAGLDMLRSENPDVLLSCEATAGLSLGEYTALVFAGVIEFDAALRVVQQRGEAMQTAADTVSSGMVSVLGLDEDRLEQVIAEAREDQILQIANYLCPGNIAISGNIEACERAAELSLKAGAMKAVPLAVAGAFHTPIMQPAVEKLTTALADVPMKAPKIKVVSNVDAAEHDDPEEIRKLLIRQVVAPVRWEESMRRLLDQGFEQFHEIGPGRVLRGLLRRINRKISCQNVLG